MSLEITFTCDSCGHRDTVDVSPGVAPKHGQPLERRLTARAYDQLLIADVAEKRDFRRLEFDEPPPNPDAVHAFEVPVITQDGELPPKWCADLCHACWEKYEKKQTETSWTFIAEGGKEHPP